MRIAPMDPNRLLTTERLSLCPDLQRGWIAHDRLLIKNVPAQLYLTVSLEQARVLETFAGGASVPEVFARLLRERRCLPLREFYELVLKAHRAGLLVSGPSVRPLRRALGWPAWQFGPGAVWPALTFCLVVLVAIYGRASSIAIGWSWMALGGGVLFSVVLLSLGEMLAAALLAGAGAEVYPLRPVESFRALHFRLDLRDAGLLRPVEQAWIMLAAALPLSLALLGALFISSAVATSLAAAWLLVWRPWGAGLPGRLAALSNRRPHLDTDSGFLFPPNQVPQLHWRPWWRRWDWRACGLELGWAVLWAFLVGRLVLQALGVGLRELVADNAAYWLVALPGVLGALLFIVLLVLFRRWRTGLPRFWRDWLLRSERARRRRREFVFPESEAALLNLAAAHPLLSLLNPYDRAALVRAWRPETYSRREIPADKGSAADKVGVILSGSVIASRESPSGRRVKALVLEEGDLFGPVAAGFDAGDGSALEFRCATRVAAMLMPVEVFRSCVLEKLGAALVHDLTCKLAFLRRLPVCANWDVHAVARFARLTQMARYTDGETIVHAGEDTNWFYILSEGTAQVSRGGRLLARLKPGAFFGEISLLQNSAAVADVVARGTVRCLQIDRNNFLRFMTHNHHVALQLERISSARLGHPVFPLRPAAISASHPFVGEARRAAA